MKVDVNYKNNTNVNNLVSTSQKKEKRKKEQVDFSVFENITRSFKSIYGNHCRDS